MLSSTDLARRALAEIGTRTTIESLDDGSNEANYAKLLYNPLRDFLLREGDYDWAMAKLGVVQASVYQPPWQYAWTYPDEEIIRVRSVLPKIYDKLRPVPVEWNLLGYIGQHFIMTNVEIDGFLYTYPAPEAVWDPLFQEAFVRLLASALAFALENRIEASKKSLEEAMSFARIAAMRQP
jgi:hypothetical protein